MQLKLAAHSTTPLIFLSEYVTNSSKKMKWWINKFYRNFFLVQDRINQYNFLGT